MHFGFARINAIFIHLIKSECCAPIWSRSLHFAYMWTRARVFRPRDGATSVLRAIEWQCLRRVRSRRQTTTNKTINFTEVAQRWQHGEREGSEHIAHISKAECRAFPSASLMAWVQLIRKQKAEWAWNSLCRENAAGEQFPFDKIMRWSNDFINFHLPGTMIT